MTAPGTPKTEQTDPATTKRTPLGKGHLSQEWTPGPQPDWSRVRRASDVELAHYIIDDWRSKQPVMRANGAFWFYQPHRGCWEQVEDAFIHRQINKLDGRPFGEVNEKGKRRTLTLGHARVRSICSTIAVEVAPESSRKSPFNAAKVGLCLPNGFITASDDHLTCYPHHPNWYQTTAIQIRYNHKATCDLWLKSLRDWFGHEDDGPDQIAMLQEFFGAALFGLAPSYARALFLLGSGGQGKSQITGVLEGLFPQEKVGSVPPQRWQKEYAVDRIAHIALNVVNELPSAAIMEGATFKAVITGDSVYARPIYGKVYAFKPKAAHLFSTNELPRSLDSSDGFWRRILLLRMTRQFRNLEGAQSGHIENLAEVILEREAEGVLAWAVEGVQRLLIQGEYTISKSARMEIESWRIASDPIREWLQQQTTPAPSLEGITPTHAYEAFARWAERNGYKLLSSGRFGRRLKQLVIQEHDGTRRLYSIRLRTRLSSS